MKRLSLPLCGLSLAMAMLTGPAIAQEDPAKKTQTAKTFWGVSAEKLEYRYSDSDEELAVIEGDAFYGTDDLASSLGSYNTYNGNSGVDLDKAGNHGAARTRQHAVNPSGWPQPLKH